MIFVLIAILRSIRQERKFQLKPVYRCTMSSGCAANLVVRAPFSTISSLSVSVKGGIFGDSVRLPTTVEAPPSLFSREPEEEAVSEVGEGHDNEES